MQLINFDYRASGERLTDTEVTEILTFTDTTEDLDGNMKYEGLYPAFVFSHISYTPTFTLCGRDKSLIV